MTMTRKERRAAEHAALKQARKAGFPTTTPEPGPEPQAATPTPEPPQPAAGPSPAFMNRPRPSLARYLANKANAQHSTGAKSETGKSTSSQNRTTHGLARHNGRFRLLPTENAAGFEALKAELCAEHKPTTVTESILVNTMAESHWLANRAQSLLDCCSDLETGVVHSPILFALYTRYQTTHTRAFHKALNDLLKLRAERRKEAIGFEAQTHKKQFQQLQIQHKIGVMTAQKLKASKQNPTFEAILNEELTKNGIETHQKEATQTAAA